MPLDTADISWITQKGSSRRRPNEDRCSSFTLSGLGTFLAVMDGFRGSDAADKARRLLPSIVEGAREAASSHEMLLKSVVVKLDERTRQLDSGCTLSLVFLPENEDLAVIAVLGDSPVIILDANDSLFESPWHNAWHNEEERAAAEERGGTYDQPYMRNLPHHRGGTQLTRALGRILMGSVVSKTPELFIVEQPRIILVATDGINKTAQPMELVQRVDSETSAESLLHDLDWGQLSDDTTLILCRVDH